MKFASGISLEFLQGFFGVFLRFMMKFLQDFFSRISSEIHHGVSSGVLLWVSLRISPEVSVDLASGAYAGMLQMFSGIPSEVSPGILPGASLSIHPRVSSELTLVQNSFTALFASIQESIMEVSQRIFLKFLWGFFLKFPRFLLNSHQVFVL